MTTRPPEKIEYCPECELEYAARQCAPCPLCPLGQQLDEAGTEVRRCEPWKVVTADTPCSIQRAVNDLEAAGWSLHDFRVGHTQLRDEANPEYVALMERREYSPELHAQAYQRKEELFAQYLEKRRGIEVASEEFKEARCRGER